VAITEILHDVGKVDLGNYAVEGRGKEFSTNNRKKFHKQPNKSSTNNRIKVPQITEKFKKYLVN
jgi:hypothetical protein